MSHRKLDLTVLAVSLSSLAVSVVVVLFGAAVFVAGVTWSSDYRAWGTRTFRWLDRHDGTWARDADQWRVLTGWGFTVVGLVFIGAGCYGMAVNI
jgi:hypothetical protein